MLKVESLANAFAISTAILYIALFVLKIIAPPFFKLFLNSQVFGADIASQIPKLNFLNFLGTLIAVSITAWIFGYMLAFIYNNQFKK